MKKKVILHVGLHKTGSTSIQLNCKRYAEQLLNAGIYYPKFSSDNWENHSVPLSLICQDKPRSINHTVERLYENDESAMKAALNMRQFLIDELENTTAHTILFSAEDISVFTSEELEKFKLFLVECGGFDFKVIVYVRHPVKFILSAAQELVRAGVNSLSNIFELGNIQNSEIKIKKLISIFGFNNVNIFSFDDSISKFKDITRHFFNLIDCNHISTDRLSENSSSSIEKILVLSSIYSYGGQYVRFLSKHLLDGGNKLQIDAQMEKYLFYSCAKDINFLKNEFGIVFENKSILAGPVISNNILYSNIKTAHAVLLGNGLDVSLVDIFSSIVRDTILYFPKISSEVAVMANNCLNYSIFKENIFYFMSLGVLDGEFFNETFVLADDRLKALNFDGPRYLIENPDVARAGADPFRHYYSYGKLEGRSGCFID
jgi:hypothetical protein